MALPLSLFLPFTNPHLTPTPTLLIPRKGRVEGTEFLICLHPSPIGVSALSALEVH